MTEISSPQALPTSAPPRPSLPAAELSVKLLQPLQNLLTAGQTAKAEVISQQAISQSFQVLLKITLENGRQATVQANSPQPLAQGTSLNVTLVSPTQLLLALQAPSKQPMTQLDIQQLPVGTLLQAKIVASQEIVQAKTAQVIYRVLANLLNTPQAGRQMSIDSAHPLPIGSLLTAQVKDSHNISFLPLSGRLNQLELGQQLLAQQNRQGSLEGLFKTLQNLAKPTTGKSALPDNLRQSAEKLLAGVPSVSELSNPKALSKAIGDSGMFLEARLLGNQPSNTPQDLKANLLRLVAQLLPTLPTSTALNSAGGIAANFAQALPAFIRSALGNIGQTNSRQQSPVFPLPSRLLQSMEGEGDLELMLRMAAAAISRLQTHQLSSLAQSQVGPDGNLMTTWQLEVPMRDQQQMTPLQIRLQREDPQAKGKAQQQEVVWRVDLAFDLEPLGSMQVKAQLSRGQLSSQLWAERTQTAQLINHELDHLRERFVSAGFAVGDLSCSQGVPPQGPRTAIEQRWIDETA